MKKKIFMVLGTRPEVIKLAPVVHRLQKCGKKIALRICATAQHRGMMDQMLRVFKLRAHLDFNLMRARQTPAQIRRRTLLKLTPVLIREKPDILIVQGDTTTAAAAARAAAGLGIPVAHVEAGLRSHDLKNPYPEEGNRVEIDALSDLLFAPTPLAAQNLLKENTPAGKIWVTGNTIVDALRWALKRPKVRPRAEIAACLERIRRERGRGRFRPILVTLHRRESFGKPLRGIFAALRRLPEIFDGVDLFFPVHPNPQVKNLAHRMLRAPRIHLLPPLGYLEMLQLMRSVHLILTDSGGIQEEAPTLGKPVLVLRKKTERPETLLAGLGLLAGTEPASILRHCARLLNDRRLYRRMSRAEDTFGDGQAARRIVDAVLFYLGVKRNRTRDWRRKPPDQFFDGEGSLSMRA
ncbi:MAG: UDP-N-acetylglucosamine 2-epimerase (non-hydrolyzing) [Elusimicrobia bacterium]|nr:UDP-N-acetylglucosamine 2-epimerase (non-hydrolyzing) [Elusimicrobiota bacterium]